jgi:hypothetical protein
MKIITDKFENPFTGEEYEQQRVYIPSKVTDNKYTNNASYIARLQMSGGHKLVQAWLHGDWSIVDGAFFEEWNADHHVIKQFLIPEHWPRMVSMDWGSAHPFSINWWAIVPDDWDGLGDGKIIVGDMKWQPPQYRYNNHLPRGAAVMYREWYGSKDHNNVGLKLTAEEVAAGINEREKREPRNENGNPRFAYRVAGKDLFSQNGGPSLAERMGAEPFRLYWQAADNSRVSRKGAIGGWDMVRHRLIGTGDRDEHGGITWVNGKPMIYFFENCVDIIRTLPALQHDAINIEDCDSDGEDHAPDSVRYFCLSRPWARPISEAGPPRAMVVGRENELRIDDVMDHLLDDDDRRNERRAETFRRIR